jgi:osmoprotectant transport system ATP-binding protein
MIKALNLVKQYGSTLAVNQVSFEVPTGENMVLLGPSGCGKTTTLRMINRLVCPESGELYINGVAINAQPAEQLRRGIGYVLQHHGLFPHYTVSENVAIVPKLLKWDTARIKNRAAELYNKLNLDETLINKYPAELSGGQQQRVGLVRALMVNPPVLLMDEPFGALDNLTRIAIRREFRELDELRNKTTVMVTHDIQEAFEMGDTICLMNKGEVMQLGTPAMLLQHPANDFVSEFLKEQRLLLALKFYKLGEQSAWEVMNSMPEGDLKALLRSTIKP